METGPVFRPNDYDDGGGDDDDDDDDDGDEMLFPV